MSRAAEHGDSCGAASGSADSAGVPWEGRSFRDNPHTADDGSAPSSLLAAIAGFRAGERGPEHVVDALRAVRLLIPLVAERGDEGLSAAGHVFDKTQELSIVTVAAPDGRTVMPAFTSITAMAGWDAAARPIPTPAVRVAQAAVGEGTDLIVVDPGSETEFVVRRPAVWALAHGEPWRPPHTSEAVRAAFLESIASELAAVDVHLAAGDPDARLAGPETVVRLSLLAGLERRELDAVLNRLAQRWAADDRIATLVDSLTVALERAP